MKNIKPFLVGMFVLNLLAGVYVVNLIRSYDPEYSDVAFRLIDAIMWPYILYVEFESFTFDNGDDDTPKKEFDI